LIGAHADDVDTKISLYVKNASLQFFLNTIANKTEGALSLMREREFKQKVKASAARQNR
jgi:hypothetical protein